MKIALVTGGSGDIGSAIVKLLANANFTVCLQYANNKNKAVAIKGGAKNIHLFHQDFNNTLHLIEDVVAKFGKIDVLINCAGILGKDNIENLTSEEFDNIFNMNTKAPYLLASKAFSNMKKTGFGRIINISSIAVHYGMGRNSSIQYAGSKAALETLTTGLSRLGASSNVLVNTIRPGAIETDMQRQRDDLQKRIDMIPVKRMGQPEEIAELVLYLLSKSGDFITGQTITVGGGE
jgi:3-oxoacyl-[acyl-carrier protein] reductase